LKRRRTTGNTSIATSGADGSTIGCSSLSATVPADEQSQAKVLIFIFKIIIEL